MRNAHRILVGKFEGKTTLRRPMLERDDNITTLGGGGDTDTVGKVISYVFFKFFKMRKLG
jgi:hypothetical protein